MYVDLDMVNWAIREVAREQGLSVEEVLHEMTVVLAEAYTNPDPDVQARWAAVPFAGEAPTPAEAIAYMANNLMRIEH